MVRLYKIYSQGCPCLEHVELQFHTKQNGHSDATVGQRLNFRIYVINLGQKLFIKFFVDNTM